MGTKIVSLFTLDYKFDRDLLDSDWISRNNERCFVLYLI